MDLTKLVQRKIESVGVKDAARLFGVSVGTASNWSTGKTPPSLAAVEVCMHDMPAGAAEPSAEVVEQVVTWEGRKVAILLPVYRSFNADTHFTLFANYAKYGAEKLSMEIIKRTVIHEARNMLIDKAMRNSDAETFIMVDDDMILPCGSSAVMNGRYGANLPENLASKIAISQIMSHGKDKGIIGALYFGRHSTGKAQCSKGFEVESYNDELRRGRVQGLVPMGWVGTGMVKIERWVIEKMRDCVDAGKWPECKPPHDGFRYGYFNPIRVGVGEDVSFGRRAEDAGIRSYLDADLVCLHVGDANYGPSNTK